MSIRTKNPFFNFGAMSSTNYNRCISPDGFNFDPADDLDFNLYMMLALSSEVGEMSGIIQKLKRGFNLREYSKFLAKRYKPADTLQSQPTYEEAQRLWEADLKVKFRKEAADVLTYLDLICSRNQIDIRRAFVAKFEEVSEQMGCPQFKIPS
jgi:NTP pyrophosphatase (non-canonical NTP hydrolase)